MKTCNHNKYSISVSECARFKLLTLFITSLLNNQAHFFRIINTDAHGAIKIQAPVGKLIHFECKILPESKWVFHDVKQQMRQTAVNRTPEMLFSVKKKVKLKLIQTLTCCSFAFIA